MRNAPVMNSASLRRSLTLVIATAVAFVLAACSQQPQPQPQPDQLAIRFEAPPTVGSTSFEVPFGGSRTLELDLVWPTDYEGEVQLSLDDGSLPAGVSLSDTEATLARADLPWHVTVTAASSVTAQDLAAVFSLPVTVTTLEPTPAAAEESDELVLTGAVLALVTNTDDDGPGSLRHLIDNVPASGSGPVVIGFDPVVFDAPATITLQSTIVLGSDHTLRGVTDGDGAPLVTLDGANAIDRLMSIKDGVTVTLDSLGFARAAQLAITNQGDLTVKNSVVTGNGHNVPAGQETWGGGIFSVLGSLTIEDSIISDNRATLGGGVYAASGTVTITGSTLELNQADKEGAGAYVHADASLAIERSSLLDNHAGEQGGGVGTHGDLVVVNSTFSGNRADTYGGAGINVNLGGKLNMSGSLLHANVGNLNGGGLFNNGEATIVNSTLTANEAMRGGAIFSSSNAAAVTRLSFSTVAWNSAVTRAGASGIVGGGGIYSTNLVEMNASIVAGNSVPAGHVGPDIYTSAGKQSVSHGYNIVGDSADAGLSGPGMGSDEYGVAAGTVLASDLVGYGPGTAELLPLTVASSAMDVIPAAHCVDLAGDPVLTDQRGAQRPTGARCDIGAFEAGAS